MNQGHQGSYLGDKEISFAIKEQIRKTLIQQQVTIWKRSKVEVRFFFSAR